MAFSYVNPDGTTLAPNLSTGALPSGSDGSAEVDPTILTQVSSAQLQSLKLLADVQPQITTDGVHLVNGFVSSGDQAKINALPADTTAALGGKVDKTTTVNGHALSGNVTVTTTDLSLNNVTNDVQTKAAVVPNTVPAAGQVLIGNAGGTAYAPKSLSGAITVDSNGVTTAALATPSAPGAMSAAGFAAEFFPRTISSVGSAVAGDIVYMVSAGVFAPANASARSTAQLICGAYDGANIFRRSMGTLINFDSQPVLGSCYLSATTAGKATNAPTYNLTIPRYLGEVVEVVDSAHAWVMLDCDVNGSTAPFKILDYAIPGAGVTLVTVPNLSAKFRYDLQVSWNGAADSLLRLRFNADGVGCFSAPLNTTPAWDAAVSATFPRIGSGKANTLSACHATVNPRIGGLTLIESKNSPESAGWAGGVLLTSVGSTTVDYTQLVVEFTTAATVGAATLLVSDPNGVG